MEILETNVTFKKTPLVFNTISNFIFAPMKQFRECVKK